MSHPKSSHRLVSILEREESIRRSKRRSMRRFSLSSLLIAVTVGGVLLACLRLWGGDFWLRLERRANQTIETFPDARVSELLPPLCVMFGVLVGVAFCYVIYHSNVRRSFVFVSIILFASICLAIWAMSLDFPPYSQTAMKHLSKRQVAYGMVMSFAINVPIFSLAGWFLSPSGRNSR